MAANPPNEGNWRFPGQTPRKSPPSTPGVHDPSANTLQPGDDAIETRAQPEIIGRYRIVERLGEGGMGVVYLAQDPHLERRVALKVPRPDPNDPTRMARFFREARSAAQVLHPYICPIHDLGEANGTPYLTMAYLEGRPLSVLVRGSGPLPEAWAAGLVRKMALALEAAHDKGVIHRDLKPSNVMVNKHDEPTIMDFGLARRVDAEDPRLTQSNLPLGTPAYMSPEQVRGDVRAIGPRTDVYSLGVILYEMLAGRRPFDGAVGEVYARILQGSPRPPSADRPGLSTRLESVCLKAMAVKIEDRYATMGELAAALGKCLERSPAKADRPPLPTSWVVRIVAGAVAALLLVGGLLLLLREIGRTPDRAVVRAEVQVDGKPIEEKSLRLAPGDHHLEVSGERIEPFRLLFTVEWDKAPQVEQRAANPRLGELIRFRDHQEMVWAAAFSRDGRSALSGDEDGEVLLWDTATGRKLTSFSGHKRVINHVAFDPKGPYALSTSDDKTVLIHDLKSGKVWKTLPHLRPVTSAVFSPDGREILSASGDKVRLWSVANGREPHLLTGHTRLVWCVAFSPDGKLALSGGDDRSVRIWDLENRRERGEWTGPTDSVLAVAFSADGREAVAVGRDRTVYRWSTVTKEQKSKHTFAAASLASVALSPDGRLVVWGGEDSGIRLVDAETGRFLYRLDGHTGAVKVVAFSTDGKRLLSGGADRTVRVWGLP
jgi:hypothetical protein